MIVSCFLGMQIRRILRHRLDTCQTERRVLCIGHRTPPPLGGVSECPIDLPHQRRLKRQGGRPGLGVLVLVLLITLLLIPHPVEPGIGPGRFGIRIPPPPLPPVTWTSPLADSADVPATYLDEADPLHGGNGRPLGLTISHVEGSGDQCVGLVTWAASIADSIVGTLDSAAVTLYRLNSDHPGANDSLEIAPLVVSWNESGATWLNRAPKKPWSDPGGDVDASLAVVVRAADIPGLYAGALDAPVTIPITPIVAAW